MGKLAQLSGGASKEIDQLIGDSRARVHQIVQSVDERVADGKSVSAEALQRFAEIAQQIGSISEKINQVGAATLEQEGGVEQTARAMDKMDEAALMNKKASDEMMKVSEEVRALNAKIRETTRGIRIYVREENVPKKPDPRPKRTPDTTPPSVTDDTVVDLMNGSRGEEVPDRAPRCRRGRPQFQGEQ
ncbi:MAG: hypothetical protein HC902_05155 [Calothrix sp. SM1_5_4]|nr:hypothetical protein [Calothrix sp. SM1_5_4]